MVDQDGRIVVGVDGSAESLEAVRWAARQAKLTGAHLEAVWAWEYPIPSGYEFGAPEMNIDWESNARKALDTALAQALDEPTSIDSAVIEGHPARVLLAAAEGAELLVVGSRGHGGFAGMLLGSVSESVIAHASCPVTVVRQPQPDAG